MGCTNEGQGVHQPELKTIPAPTGKPVDPLTK